jgi:histone H3/H4
MESKSSKLVDPPFPKAMLARIFKSHTIRKTSRISKGGIEQLGKTLDEVAGWIISEAERLAVNSGKSTIASEHIKEATAMFFGKGGGDNVGSVGP